ncbi:hypothetical protein IC619_015270 [Hazenella sp. IB182353]|uniref:XkdF-like putative serine protease domain-containing protein n=1 Tax=Polycladospora coralii TaxID=2771432 RepID=UPI00174650C4|nr:XkdF-like putative serine protease domain-containing protein [Polycladospora coralii]MBS7531832.1 hypothetical protein [Polycladospora coralii]
MPELTAPLVMKSYEKRIVYGPVMVPGEADHDGDVVSADKIEAVAHDFADKYANIDLQHTLNNVGSMVESYITPVDLTYGDMVVPKGSWMMGVRVTDDESWSSVKEGKLTGFSIMGIKSAVMKSKKDDEINAALKRTTLADLGEDWIVNAVSLVDEPCVPKAKFVVIKSKTDEVEEKPDSNGGFFAKFIQSFKHADPPGKKGDDMTKEDVQTMIDTAVKTAFQEVAKEFNKEEESTDHIPEQETNDPPAAQEQESDQVTLTKDEYNTLTEKIEELEEVAQKARHSGLFFNSQKLKGQDGDNTPEASEKEKHKRDAFGRRINS